MKYIKFNKYKKKLLTIQKINRRIDFLIERENALTIYSISKAISNWSQTVFGKTFHW